MNPTQSILKTVPKDMLSAIGLKRWKQSRNWFDDHGWHIIMIEFQPISGELASALNVGVSLLWNPKDYFSYDIGSRESKVITFQHENQFTDEVRKLSQLAVEKVLHYRQALQSRASSMQQILNHRFVSETLQSNFHKAIASGLMGDVALSFRYFNNLLNQKPECNADEALLQQGARLRHFVQDPERFKLAIVDNIHQSRNHLKLPVSEDYFTW